MNISYLARLLVILSLLFALAACAYTEALTTAFTYQGKLTDSSGVPVSGSRSMTFKLFDAANAAVTPTKLSGFAKCRARRLTNQNPGIQPISWEVDDLGGTYNMWTAASPTRVTLPATGSYLIAATVTFTAANGTYAGFSIDMNGLGSLASAYAVVGTSGITLATTTVLPLLQNDYLQVVPHVGVAYTVLGGMQSHFDVTRLPD